MAAYTKKELPVEAVWDEDTDAIVLVNPNLEETVPVTVRMKIFDMEGHEICHLQRRMEAEAGRRPEVWKLPGPKDPFVQIYLGGADGAESAAPAPKIFFGMHRMQILTYDASGHEMSQKEYVRDGEKRQSTTHHLNPDGF